MVFPFCQLEFHRDNTCNNTWYFRKRIFWNLAVQPPERAPKVVLKKIQIPKHVGIPVKSDGAKKIWWNSSPVHIFGYLKKATRSGPLLDHSWTTFGPAWTTFWTIAGPQLSDSQTMQNVDHRSKFSHHWPRIGTRHLANSSRNKLARHLEKLEHFEQAPVQAGSRSQNPVPKAVWS